MHVIVLGGGISGLATAWFLKQRGCNVTLLEASSRPGGWVHTDKSQDFLFELGPRSCRGNATAMLSLIEELGLQQRVITGATAAKKRFLYVNQRLRPLPSNPFSFLVSPLTRPLIWPLIRECFVPPSSHDDESIHDFIQRRLSGYAADTFMNPLVSGIYAGDPRKLSLKSCFPSLHQWEREKGSIIKGILSHKKEPGSRKGIFSLRGGMQELTDTLAQRIGDSVSLNSRVIALTNHSATTSDGTTFHADHIVSTLPITALANLVPNPSLLYDTTYSSVAVVAMGFHHSLLRRTGFGYLIPSSEAERVLGMVWDSCVFPEQNQRRHETRITCMIGGQHVPNFDSYSEEDFVAIALEALDRHLHIKAKPDALMVKLAKEAIPQYHVGHAQRILKINASLTKITLLGNSFSGVSVNDCIAEARRASDGIILANKNGFVRS